MTEIVSLHPTFLPMRRLTFHKLFLTDKLAKETDEVLQEVADYIENNEEPLNSEAEDDEELNEARNFQR